MVNMRSESPHGRSGDETENLIRLNCRKSSDDYDLSEFQDDEMDNLQRLAVCRLNNTPMSPRTRMEQDKRVRREIANSNERRRMQSINAGFQSLRALLPRKDGEKISKASILQQTADMLQRLQSEKMQLVQQNLQFKQQLNEREPVLLVSPQPVKEDVQQVATRTEPLAPPKKRLKRFQQSENTDSSDEGVGMMSDDAETCVKLGKTDECVSTSDSAVQVSPASPERSWEAEMIQRQLIEIQLALDRERRLRIILEEQLRQINLGHFHQSLGRLPLLGGPSLLDYPSTPSTLTTLHPAIVPDHPISPIVTTTVAMGPSTSQPNPPLEPIPALDHPHQYYSPSVVPVSTPAPIPQSSCSKQSLEVIVEAIRHLEGDQLFVDVDSTRPTLAAGRVRTLGVVGDSVDSGISSPIADPSPAMRQHVIVTSMH